MKLFSFRLKNPSKAKVILKTQKPPFSLTLGPDSESGLISGVYYDALKPYIEFFKLGVISASPGEKEKPVETVAAKIAEVKTDKPFEVAVEVVEPSSTDDVVSEDQKVVEEPALQVSKIYEENELRSMYKGQLSEILTEKGLHPYGYKEELVQRILDYQSGNS